MLQLKVLLDTLLKLRPIQSSLLPDEEEYAIEAGTLLNVHSYAIMDDHLKVAFADQSFNGRNTWYVHRAFAQLFEDGKPIVMDGKQLRITQNTALKLKPVQSDQLTSAEKLSVKPGELFNIHAYAAENEHIRVMSFGQFEGQNTWYVYRDHAEVLEDGEPVSFGGKAPKELSEEDYQRAASVLGVSVPAIKAVVRVETSGGGFFKDGSPKILFEAHWFSKYTNHQYDNSHRDISSREWNRELYIGGVGEYKRLEKAKTLNESAALMSASWGLGQVMGGNYKMVGYPDVKSFVKDMYESESKQLLAMVNYIQANEADAALKALNWDKFAEIYNGKNYKKNKYHIKLAKAHQHYSAFA